MKKRVVASLLFLSQFGSIGHAALTPQSYSSDARITRVAYQENNVVRLKGRAFVSTQILFSPKSTLLMWMVATAMHGWLPFMIIYPTLRLSSLPCLIQIPTLRL